MKILKILFCFIVVGLFANTAYLNWYLFIKEQPVPQKAPAPVVAQTIPLPVSNSCPETCLQLINEATSSIQIPTPVIIKEAKPAIIQREEKEVVIPLGIGSTTSVNWIDLDGIEVYLDSKKYAGYKSANFEASLRIPSGNGKAFSQLYNVTAKHPVWFSEVTLEGSTGKMLVSQEIRLDEGNNLYRVQLKSSIGAFVNLDNARIRISF